MKNHDKRTTMVRWWLAALTAVLLAGPAFGQNEGSVAAALQEALRGPERKELPVKVQVLPPRLTYQQRYLAEVRAAVSVAELHRTHSGNDLYFLLKVADEQGHWLDGDTHNHFVVPADLAKQSEIQFAGGLYARPGTYTLTLVTYDKSTGQATRWQGPLRVAELKNDPLPGMDRDLPTIEFIKQFPKESVPSSAEEERPANEDAWPLGHRKEWLPVTRGRPLRVDVIVNFSQRVDTREKLERATFAFRQTAGRLLQIGSVLSHLDVQSGCVRVSVVDTLRMKVLFDRADGQDLDWDSVAAMFNKLDQNSVDVHTLENRTQASAFLRQFLTDVENDTTGCGSEAKPDRAVVVVASPVAFPEGTKLQRLEPECQCRFYYVHTSTAGLAMMTDRQARPRGRPDGVIWPREWPGTRVVATGDSTDDIDAMLKPAKPRHLNANNPRQFRAALAELINDLRTATSGRSTAHEAN